MSLLVYLYSIPAVSTACQTHNIRLYPAARCLVKESRQGGSASLSSCHGINIFHDIGTAKASGGRSSRASLSHAATSFDQQLDLCVDSGLVFLVWRRWQGGPSVADNPLM